MAIPFRNQDDLDAPGSAAFLKIGSSGSASFTGGLFQINARGEPLEFTRGTVEVPSSDLWRPQDAKRRSICDLIAALFDAAVRSPVVLVCLAAEVAEPIFRDHIHVRIPTCRLAAPGDGPVEVTVVGDEGWWQIYWVGTEPGTVSPARRMVATLQARNLLAEPFERAAEALRAPSRA